jgi:hypothetical protein
MVVADVIVSRTDNATHRHDHDGHALSSPDAFADTSIMAAIAIANRSRNALCHVRLCSSLQVRASVMQHSFMYT